jgi:Spx/MgsR family transcriptional regulator
MITVYGLKNCDTCRKALKWLKAENISHVFHDLRQDGASRDQIVQWLKILGADLLINRRSTTWRGLDEADRNIVDTAHAADLIVAHPALIKRPLIEHAGSVFIGFGDDVKQALSG